ncbi:hypothetical protein B7H18_17795 [Pseudomonas putida]|nr:hypothetical protein B7H18_17795 [Pseudomonas putida]
MFEHSVQLLGSGQFEKADLSIPGVCAQEHPLLCKVVYATLHGLGFVLDSSRVNPLPHGYHCPWNLCSTCGSGFTREEAGSAKQRFQPLQLLLG